MISTRVGTDQRKKQKRVNGNDGKNDKQNMASINEG